MTRPGKEGKFPRLKSRREGFPVGRAKVGYNENMGWTAPLLVAATLIFTPLLGQGSSSQKKPVLIRADQPRQQTEVVEKDPARAKENVEIGDFYYNRENYKAAEDRYRDAIRFHPEWAEPYEKLIRVLEKQKAFDRALEVCRDFLEANPESSRRERFEELSRSLQAKLSASR